MTQPTGSMRKLDFPLNLTEDMESDVGTEIVPIVDLSDWSEPDPDVRIPIVLDLSLNEYIALASAVDVGRDIAYGDNSIYIWWLWVRSLESMAICQAIIDCIETDDAVRIAINDSVAGLPDVDGSPIQYGQEVFPPPVGCDKDETWGYVDALWEFIHTNNVDFLEQLNEATNQAGQINTLFKFIPGFEQIPVSDFLAWIENLGEYNLDAYNASVTVAIQDAIKCDLFCIAVNNNCSISFGDVYDYFLTKFGGFNPPTLGATFLELVVFMVTGAYPSDRIIYLWSLVQLGFAFIGANFLSLNSVRPYAIQAQNGDPDDDWILLCDSCDDLLIVTFDGAGYLDYVITNGTLDATVGNPSPSAKYEVQATTEIVTTLVTLPSASTVSEVGMDVIGSQGRATVKITVFDSLGVPTVVHNTLEFFAGWKTFNFAGAWSDIETIEYQAAVTAGALDEQWIDNLKALYLED